MNKSKVEKISFFSKALKKEMSMLVYVPKCYNSSDKLPVLYFLHGRSGNENIMNQLSINDMADNMIQDGEISSMIIVCPRIENSRGINSSIDCKEVENPMDDNRIVNLGMYEDYLIKEVIPLVDKTYKTINDKKGRFIGGISAGGYVALHSAFNHKDLFSKVGGHMPALDLKLEEEDKLYFKTIDIWEKYNPISLAENNNFSEDINVYLDAGNKDEGEFFKGCKVLHEILIRAGVNTQNHIYDGNHSAKYIMSNLSKYLKFYGC